jgi:hypothetical protein
MAAIGFFTAVEPETGELVCITVSGIHPPYTLSFPLP